MYAQCETFLRAPAKERIRLASTLLFARTPFSETSLRDIATAAQVDVAYVHRSFGSKAEIFRQTLHSLTKASDIFQPPTDPETLIDRFCDSMLLRDPQRVEDVEPFHLVMQSCACSEARIILAEFIETNLARPLADAFGHKDVGKAVFALSLMGGFTTARLVIGHRCLQDMTDADLKPMLVKILRAALFE